jgi:glucose-1-phosphate cytidylyltransferase
MKVVILCGGRGTRLAEETEYRPKPLVEIGGKPILWHIMKIYERQGFGEFILCLGYKGNMIKDYFLNMEEMSNNFILHMKDKRKQILSNNYSFDAKIFFIETGLNAMTGARIARIKKFIGDDEDFFLTYGDGLANINLSDLYRCHKKSGAVVTITGVRPFNPFGLLEIQQGFVKQFHEKPAMTDIVNGGFMVCNRKIFDYLSEDENCVLEQDPLKRLAQERKIAVYEHKGFWGCMDTQKHVNDLNKLCENKTPPWESILGGVTSQNL